MKKAVLIIFLLIFNTIQAQEQIKVKIEYKDESAKKVMVAGSFNNWNPEGYELQKENDVFKIELSIAPGYYYYKLVVDGNWITDPSNPLKVNDGGEGNNSILKAGFPPVPKRKIVANFLKERLPIPFLRNDEGFIDLYYAAWQMAISKLSQGNKSNGFVNIYMDEGFNEMIYQWDTNFMVLFGLYGERIFHAIESLDNFYLKQRKNGYIQRVYSEENGKEATEPTPEEPMVNPPLFAFVELQYYHFSGDSSRIRRVLPVLINYFEWLDKNCKSVISDNLYYNTPLGSGMDNVPRENVNKGAYVDFSFQMALFAKSLSELAKIDGDKKTSSKYSKKYTLIKNEINKKLYKNGFYYDLKEDKTLSSTKHIGAFWGLLSETTSKKQSLELIKFLEDTLTFNRPHRVPALSADEKEYDEKGHYWKGGVWAPTNYMVVKGLEKNGYEKEAYEIAYNHISNMYKVYKYFNPDTNKIAYEERYGDNYRTIWECYSPELNEPGTRWDNTFYSRQDFVGWSGLGAITLLIENIIGIRIAGSENSIKWNIMRDDMHGLLNVPLKDQLVSIVFNNTEGKYTIRSGSEKPYKLVVNFKGKKFEFEAGKEHEEIFNLN